jgi:hypothetical protein
MGIRRICWWRSKWYEHGGHRQIICLNNLYRIINTFRPQYKGHESKITQDRCTSILKNHSVYRNILKLDVRAVRESPTGLKWLNMLEYESGCVLHLAHWWGGAFLSHVRKTESKILSPTDFEMIVHVVHFC